MRTKWKFTVSYVPLTFIRSFCCLLLVPKLILTIKKKFFFSVAFLPTKQLKILRKTLPYKFKASFYFFFSLILFVYSFCFFSDTCEMFVFSSFLFRNCNNDNFYSAFGDAITKLMILSLSFSISFLPNSDRFLVPWNFWWDANSVFENYGLKEGRRAKNCLELIFLKIFRKIDLKGNKTEKIICWILRIMLLNENLTFPLYDLTFYFNST